MFCFIAMYYVYILECADKTLYVGITNDIERRLKAHNGSTVGAKYTRSRRPVVLRYKQAFRTRGKALRREYALKQLTRAEKFSLMRVRAV